MNVGYVRVSTLEQHEGLQRDALAKAGCEKIFSDKISGATFERKGLQEALAFMRSGDTLVVWKLDRLGRSLQHLIEFINTLYQRQVNFISLTEQIDTTTPGGKLIFHFMGALAEFERDLLRERTRAGLASARARGRVGGRPRAITSPAKLQMVLATYHSGKQDIEEICKTFGVSKSTLYRYTREERNANDAATHL